MSTQTDQLGINQIIAQQMNLNQHIVDAFIAQLFNEIEKNLVVDSHIKVDGLGLFRVIKSGNSHRVLYLGSNKPTDVAIDLSHLENEPKKELKVEVKEKLPDNEKQSPFSTNNEYGYSVIETTDENVSHALDEQISESDAIVIQNYHNAESKSRNTTNTVENARKSNLIKTCIITLIILVVLVIGYFLLLGSAVKPEEKFTQDITFKELDNPDSINYSFIVIPDSDVSLQYIAKTYYGNDIYWPYIYEANKNIINNLLIIQAGSITKVPKISVDLANLHNGKEASIARSLGDEIYKQFR